MAFCDPTKDNMKTNEQKRYEMKITTTCLMVFNLTEISSEIRKKRNKNYNQAITNKKKPGTTKEQIKR